MPAAGSPGGTAAENRVFLEAVPCWAGIGSPRFDKTVVGFGAFINLAESVIAAR